ncbi:flavodoxin family protein [Nocardia sp. CWNU-33]|uniref:flavodoxin family protein n=1 Tax=Nocardia sp. CWNU-33 TaxID=3392117 RepID=UPI00398F18E4
MTLSTRSDGGIVLGLSCGQPGGSAELLLTAALSAAREGGMDARLVRLDDLEIAPGPNTGTADDTAWFWEQLIECDALIVAVPVLTRTIPGRLKLLADRILGPNADAAITTELLRLQASGVTPAVSFRVDERVLRPRVAGFIAVGGSLTPRWTTLALPLLHTLTFSMRIAVVDQVQFAGAGMPRSIVLDDSAIARATQLGRNVTGQIGVHFEDAKYLGDKPGLCPSCHLDVFVLRGQEAECATCGASGELVVVDGAVTVRFPGGEARGSVTSMEELRDHFFEIQQTAAGQGAQADEIARRAKIYEPSAFTVRPER